MTKEGMKMFDNIDEFECKARCRSTYRYCEESGIQMLVDNNPADIADTTNAVESAIFTDL